MELYELQPFIERLCDVLIQCSGCGCQHALRGQLQAAPRVGDVSLGGLVYYPAQILAIWLADEQPRGPGIRRRRLHDRASRYLRRRGRRPVWSLPGLSPASRAGGTSMVAACP